MGGEKERTYNKFNLPVDACVRTPIGRVLNSFIRTRA